MKFKKELKLSEHVLVIKSDDEKLFKEILDFIDDLEKETNSIQLFSEVEFLGSYGLVVSKDLSDFISEIDTLLAHKIQAKALGIIKFLELCRAEPVDFLEFEII